jgi:hypothetical protein
MFYLMQAEFYQHEKIQLEIFNIRGCTKNAKSDRFWDFNTYIALFTIIDVRFYHFCTAQSIRYFELKFYTLVKHNIVYI